MDKYLGILKDGSSYLKERNSKFHGFAIPVESIEHAKTYLMNQKEQHSQANHFCYAYRIGLKSVIERFSDDGEPSNSSGRPILHALLSAKLDNSMIVVVRYFGGKKLGVSGLIYAYGQTAQMALKNATLGEKTILESIHFSAEQEHLYLVYELSKKLKIKMVVNQNKVVVKCVPSMTTSIKEQLIKIPTLVLLE